MPVPGHDHGPRHRAVVRFMGVGDAVMMTPLLRQAALQGPLTLITRSWGPQLLGREGYLHQVHGVAHPYGRAWPISLLFGDESKRLANILARAGFDEIAIFPLEAPEVRRWVGTWQGQARVVEWPLRFRPDVGDPPHVVDRIPAACTALKITLEGLSPPSLTVTAEMRATVQARLRSLGGRVVAVQAGSSLTDRWLRRRPHLKGLAPQQWSALIACVLEDARSVILLGTAPERREARRIVAAIPRHLRPRVHDWTGTVPLAELVPLLAECSACISVDTGPGHVAAAVGCPLLTIFGPTDPRQYAPRGRGPVEVILGRSPCQYCHHSPLWKTCASNTCLVGLPSATLVQGWKRLLDRMSPDSAQVSTQDPAGRTSFTPGLSPSVIGRPGHASSVAATD